MCQRTLRVMAMNDHLRFPQRQHRRCRARAARRPWSRPTSAPPAPTATTTGPRRMIERCSDVFERQVTALPAGLRYGRQLHRARGARQRVRRRSTVTRRRTSTSTNAARRSSSPVPSWSPLRGADYKLVRRGARLERCSSPAAATPTRVQPFALNITQPTDFGTLYTRRRSASAGRVAHRHGLQVHMDGARFANAAARRSAAHRPT